MSGHIKADLDQSFDVVLRDACKVLVGSRGAVTADTLRAHCEWQVHNPCRAAGVAKSAVSAFLTFQNFVS